MKRSLPGLYVQRNRALEPHCSVDELYCVRVRKVMVGDTATSIRTEARSTSKAPASRSTSFLWYRASVDSRLFTRRPKLAL